MPNDEIPLVSHTERFKRVYKQKYIECANRNKAEYGFGPEYGYDDLTAQVAIDAESGPMSERMTKGLANGAANHDSNAVRATCRAIGIKPTKKAIQEYLKS